MAKHILLLRKQINYISYKSMLPFTTRTDELDLSKENQRRLPYFEKLLEKHAEFDSKLTAGKELVEENWKTIQENLCTEIKELHIESTIIDLCFFRNSPEAVISYFKFLKKHNSKIHLSTIQGYLKAVYSLRDKLTDSDKKQIVQTCDHIFEEYPYLDNLTLSNCIQTLCLTEKWQNAIKFLERAKLHSNTEVASKSTIYSTIISTAFENGEIEIGFQYLLEFNPSFEKEEYFTNFRNPSCIYHSYLKYCENKYIEKSLFLENMGRMFYCWRNQLIVPVREVLDEYAEVFRKKGYSAKFTVISMQNECKSCFSRLSSFDIDDNTYNKLNQQILEKSIIKLGNDIYTASTPIEVQKFLQFLEKTKPYDIVVDGLNVTSGNQNGIQNLTDTVEYLSNKNMKILVIGRSHMKLWNKEALQKLQHYAKLFLLQNFSRDDPFVLYAALKSGKKTGFLTCDLMRQHRHALDDAYLQAIFKIWQITHQYTFKGSKVIEPKTCMPLAQKNIKGWHLPYVNKKEKLNTSRMKGAVKIDGWLCISDTKRMK
ncbi:mitochondrial ribonuclease P catalytic subunit [Prorops nasuta]|uniref:mitochondrial ribonuclease P catalytic subunit n=1 Tax=Prorops nasuta TaxID=863751 RepID=UPI0034CF9FD4